jgi:hypothetical protein
LTSSILQKIAQPDREKSRQRSMSFSCAAFTYQKGARRILSDIADVAAERNGERAMQDYTTTFSVDQTPKQAFDAINNVRGWWSGEIEGNTNKLGDEFSYRYKDIHYSKQKLVEVISDKKVVWLIVEATLSFAQDKTEWNGTKVVFEIANKGGKTEVRFTHQGLVPQFECFQNCSTAWSFYVNGSLRNLITTGKGGPNEKES